MITVKQAVEIALRFIEDLYGKRLLEVRLEELELTEDGKCWNVTIGYSRPEPATTLELYANPKYLREYKAIKINAGSGEVQSMKIRET